MTTVTVTTTGAGSFTIPANVTAITVEIWGPGQGGGTAGGASQEAGGAGGKYSSIAYTVTAGDIIYWDVGAANAAGSSANITWVQKNTNSSTGAWQIGSLFSGGGADGGTDTFFPDANGGAGAAAQGGGGSRGGSGGGGSGGPLGNGAAGAAGSGSAAGAGGTGNNGNTAKDTSNVEGGGGATGGAGGGGAGLNGGAPGGGGGGGGSSSGTSGTGGRGQLRYTYTAATPGMVVQQRTAPFLHNLLR